MQGKLTHIRLLWLLLLPLFFSPAILTGQDWEGQHDYLLLRNWELNVSSGFSSYYGDLSIYDNSFSDKLSKESGPAFGIMLVKRLSPEFGFGGQILAGQLQGRKENVSMESSILEYNFQFRLNIVRMFSKTKLQNLNWDVYAGVGNFLFKSTKKTFLEGEVITEKHNARVPEFVYFVGSGISYKINEKISLGIDLSMHQFQNDKIDVTARNSDFDYFSYMNVGFTYYFRSLQKGTIRNKARIAHSDERLKPLDND